jgi:hypothetical protein
MAAQFASLARAVQVSAAKPNIPTGSAKLGASFTAAKVIVTVAAAEEAVPVRP